MAVTFQYLLADHLVLVDPSLRLRQAERHLYELKVAGAFCISSVASRCPGKLDYLIKLKHVIVFFLFLVTQSLKIWVELHQPTELHSVAPDNTLLY